ncbi:alpha/beta fold hydrolase [Nitrospirillum amazonense]|uniref:alpha/beta fold hydrolase n=1 Tax=Nitrospirillum amazonense TaxID=28077 RepID=UPI001FE2E9E0|nr:alpha/beta hydrolase [Nitrospirillum amazonense]
MAHLKGRAQTHVLTLAGAANQAAWQSDASHDSFTRTVEDQLADYIRVKGLVRPMIVGHSIGANIALEFAERYPDLVGKLVLVDALPFQARVWFNIDSVTLAKPLATATRLSIKYQSRARYEKFIRGPSTRSQVASDADFEKVVRWGLAADQSAVADTMYEVLTTDLRPQLGAFAAPTLVVETWAGTEGATRDQIEQEFHAQYAGLRRVKFAMSETGHHFVMLDEPDWFNRQIDQSLSDDTAAR